MAPLWECLTTFVTVQVSLIILFCKLESFESVSDKDHVAFKERFYTEERDTSLTTNENMIKSSEITTHQESFITSSQTNDGVRDLRGDSFAGDLNANGINFDKSHSIKAAANKSFINVPTKLRFRRQAALSPFWRRARVLFPDVHICLEDEGENSTRMGSYGILRHCSTGCSCSPDCYLENNCCFPGNESTATVWSNLTCVDTIPLWSQSLSPKGPMFYQVAHCPDGTIPNVTNSPYLFYNITPVYSPSTRLIYANEKVLHCHGLNDGIFWDFEFQCPIWMGFRIHFDILVNGDMERVSGWCLLRFFYPYDINDIGKHVCHTALDKPMSICKVERVLSLRITPETGMTAKEVFEACVSGPVAPVLGIRQIYKNPFCALCYNSGMEFPEARCSSNYEHETSNSHMTMIVYRPKRLISMLEERASRNISQPLACLKASRINEKDDCRPVYCPLGRIRMPDGSCYMIGYKRPRKYTGVCLMLTSDVTLEQDEVDQLLDYFITNRKLPWPAAQTAWTLLWKWKELSIRVPDASNRNGTEIIALLLRNSEPVDFESLLSVIEKVIRQSFSLKIGNKLVAFKQSLRHSCQFLYANKTSRDCREEHTVRVDGKFYDITFPKTVYKCDVDDSTTLRWFYNVMILTRLLYCPRVELDVTEFVHVMTYVIHVYKQNKTFIRDDFEINHLSNKGPTFVLLCADDLGYTIRVTSSCKRHQLARHISALTVAFGMLLVYVS